MKTATVVGEKSLVETNNKGEQCLIVRLLTSKSYNKEAFTTAMRKHWRPIFKLSDCWDLDEHTFVFSFEDTMDKKIVCINSLRSIDKSLVVFQGGHFTNVSIVFQDCDGESQVANLQFRWAFFWIQLHICMGYLSRE